MKFTWEQLEKETKQLDKIEKNLNKLDRTYIVGLIADSDVDLGLTFCWYDEDGNELSEHCHKKCQWMQVWRTVELDEIYHKLTDDQKLFFVNKWYTDGTEPLIFQTKDGVDLEEHCEAFLYNGRIHEKDGKEAQ